MIQPTSGGWKADSTSSVAMVTIPAVPTTAMASPGLTTPTPSDDAVTSNWPLNTGVPARSPVASAASLVTSPHSSVGAFSGGSQSRTSAIPNVASASSDQSRVRTSMPMRLGSDGSVEMSPVSLYSTQSLHPRFLAPLPATSDLFSS